MKIDRLPILRTSHDNLRVPDPVAAWGSAFETMNMALNILSPYYDRYFRSEELPALLVEAAALAPAMSPLVGDSSLAGNFAHPDDVAPAARFLRRVAYIDLADVLDETARVLDSLDPAHIRAYFSYGDLPDDVSELLSLHLNDRPKDVIRAGPADGDYFDVAALRASRLFREADIFLPVQTKEALFEEIADLVEVLPQYETRRNIRRYNRFRPEVFDVIVAAGERYMDWELLKSGGNLRRKPELVARFPATASSDTVFGLRTTLGDRLGYVSDGFLQMIDAKTGMALSEVDYR